MRRPIDLAKEESTMVTLVTLTNAFQGIASSHLAKIRSEVLKSNAFFEDLWQIYSQIRVDKIFHFGRSTSDKVNNEKELFIIITGEGGFSGDVDIRIIQELLKVYDSNKHDIVVIGRHGGAQLSQRGIKYKKIYRLPAKDLNINVNPLVQDVGEYKSTTVFYPQYLTLTNQKIRSVKLSAVVQEMGQGVKVNEELISEVNYIFEPSVSSVVGHLERTMLGISLSQFILDSKLAQYASRFQAMTLANHTAVESRNTLHTQYRRAVRGIQDERLKEIINSIRKIRVKV